MSEHIPASEHHHDQQFKETAQSSDPQQKSTSQLTLGTVLEDNIATAMTLFPIGKSFDLITRHLNLGHTQAYWIGINGFCRNELLQNLFSLLQNPLYTRDSVIYDLKNYMDSKIGYSQAELTSDWNVISKQIFSGASALLVDGFDECLILDTRSYPTRSIAEPDSEKVTRGPRDGFVETIVFNTALIRRHIRNPRLTFRIKTVGSDSKTDIAIGFIDGKADSALVSQLESTLEKLPVTALTVGSKSLEELLVPKSMLHPLPSFFSTERPDVACSYLSEGHIVLIVDNSPAILVMPCTFFQFTQNPEDYYKNPIVGNYIRLLRFFALIGSLLLLPLLFLTGYYSDYLPGSIVLFESQPPSRLTLLFSVLMMEAGLDIFRYASSHTTSRFSAALSIVGGLVLSDSAVRLGWMSFEIMFYGAVTLLLTLCLTGIELGEGIRIYRIFMIISTGIAGIWGFCISLLLIILSAATTPTFGHTSYLWPLIPLNLTALKTLLFRYPTQKAQPITLHYPKSKVIK